MVLIPFLVYLPLGLGLFIKLKIIYLAAEIKKLGASFYNRPDVLEIARDLLGKILVTKMDRLYTSGRIVETEAYAGVTDRASHAYGGRRTDRTEVMYGRPGHAYIYFVYGMHHLFNVVTAEKNIPHAILIRALEPVDGIQAMMKRTGKLREDPSLTRGPGNLSKALGLRKEHTGISLLGNKIFIVDDGFKVRANGILSTARIGVDYAGEDAKLLYRFVLRGNKWISAGKITDP
jgi:DNA-3-methyladenine glycosylase